MITRSLLFATLNVNHAAGDDATAIVKEISKQVGKRGLFLQEVEHWATSDFGEDAGYKVYKAVSGKTVIAIPDSFAGGVKTQYHHRRFSIVIIGLLMLVSVYLPDTSKLVAKFENVIRALRIQMRYLKTKFSIDTIYLGGDLNVELPGHCSFVTGPFSQFDLGGSRHYGNEDCIYKQFSLLDFLESFGISVANTFLDNYLAPGDFFTRASWTAGQRKTQIDCLGISWHLLPGSAVAIRNRKQDKLK